jgi:P-type Ca2+ transporter type 2C
MEDKLNQRPWSADVKDILSLSGTILETGLSNEDVDIRLKLHGHNVLKTENEISNVAIFLKQFNNPMVYTLFSATVIAAFLGETLDAIAILAILFLNSFIGYFQESKASAAIHALKKLSVPHTRVLREGKIMVIPSGNVVPGDIIQLEAGDYVTADARLIEAFQLSADEAPLTGESLPVKKSAEIIHEQTLLAERKNMVHAGSAISNGSGRGLVMATGMKTQIGKIAELLEETHFRETPLQKRLTHVSNRLILLGGVVIVLVVIIHFIKGEPWFSIFMAAISLAIAAIPEGLPTVVTLALTLAVRRMTRRKAIMRNLSAVETLGSTDVICTDKTGTLTTGVMTVREVFLLDQSLKDRFLEAIVLCNNASIDHGGSGDPTEKALLDYVDKMNVSLKEVHFKYPRVHEWSFESERKRMSVAVKNDHRMRIVTKGAPETMLDRCNVSDDEKKILLNEIHKLTSKGQRLLAVAEKDGELHIEADIVERNLQFLGLISMADPPKSETINAIKECQDAGIKVIMITGDHPVTAKAIAIELGIAIPGEFDEVLAGKDLENLSFEELRSRVEKTAVYARVSPLHKLRIVEALQYRGHVVAMTGDGVNDAPALKKAQIGVAMGKAGTEVARQASSMVLTDDNFSTIVSAVKEGRSIYGNIKRTIQYLLSTNLSEILIVLGSSIFQMPVPFTPIGLLWINLVTDGFPSLALAAEPLSESILQESKRPSPSTFFDRAFILELFLVGLLMTAICLGVYFYALGTYPEILARSYAFSLLVNMTLFRSFSCRSETRSVFSLKANYYHLLSVLVPIILQLTLVKTDLYQSLFNVQEISLKENLILLMMGLIPVTVIELFKFWRRS